MKRALRQAFEDGKGKISRKAIGFYLFGLLYIAVVIVNITSKDNKNVLNTVIEGHLFWILQTIILAIFAERAMNNLGDKIKSSI